MKPINCGQRVFGENKVQELVSKQNNYLKISMAYDWAFTKK